MNILTLASGLSAHDLLARLGVLAGKEREATVELVAHLAALDARPSVYAALGFGSLFSYCTDVLRLSEDATCNRIKAARACRQFPMILDRLAAGTVSLTSVRLLSPHLTAENHEAVLMRAERLRRRDVEALVAELAPRPDAPATVRKVPTHAALEAKPPAPTVGVVDATPQPVLSSAAGAPVPPAHRPIIETTSPERYRVQFTIGKESHDLDKVEKAKRGATRRPQAIRSGTDSRVRTPIVPSRDIPAHVQREVSRRDGDRCAYVAPDGRRCTERSFLEFHHLVPFARGGPATVENISLRCRRHNQYEAELAFGARADRGPRATAGRPPGAAAHGPADRVGPGTTLATPV